MKYTLRIKKNKDFKYIFKKGKFYKGRFINIYYIKNKSNEKINNFGVCVSKKNGKAFERNKLKRWVRQIYKFEENKLKRNINIVILYKKSTTLKNIDFNLIYKDFRECIEGLNLYEKNN